MELHFLIDTIVLLGTAVVAVPVFQSIKLGAIPGFLIAGFLLGPSVLGYFRHINDIRHLAELGVVLLLFVIGIELRPSHFWRMRHQVFGLGSAQLGITTLALSFAISQLFDLRLSEAILIGAALSLSSTAFVLQLLAERRALKTTHGRSALAILLLQDLAVVPLLVFVSILTHKQQNFAFDMLIAVAESAAILLFVIFAARYVLNPLLTLLARFGSTDIFTATALLLVLGFAVVFESLGLSLAMGAFVAGLLIGDSSFRHQISAEVEPFRSLLLGLFFMTMGMSLNLATLLNYPVAIFASLLGLLLVKGLIIWLLARAFGIAEHAATALGLLLSQSGEFALVLFAEAYSNNIVSMELFQSLLVVVLLSMLATPVLNAVAQFALSKKSEETQATIAGQSLHDGEQPALLIVGFGRMGHRIAELLERLHIPYVAIDNNITLVNEARRRGRPVYYGDAQKPEVLRAAGAPQAPLAIVAIDHLEGAEKVVTSLHSAFPDLPIFARGHNRARCRQLRACGATATISETFEASSEIAREALLLIGLEKQQIEATLANFKRDYYAAIEKP